MGSAEFAGGARERRRRRGLDVALSRRRPVALSQAWRVRRRRRRRSRPDRRSGQDRRGLGHAQAVRRAQRSDDRRARLSRRQSVAVAASILEGPGRGRARAADRRRGRTRLRRQVRAARCGSPSSSQPRARSCAPSHGSPSRRSLHSAVPGAESGRVRRLRDRQVVASGDAGPGDADRHRRHRACRRARPRSARISSRHARRGPRLRGRGRFDRRREPHDAPPRPENRDGDRRILPRSGRNRCC